MSVFSSVANGFLSWVVGNIPEDAPLARWQYLYLLTGSLNVLYSVFMLFYLPNSPINARFLSLEERWHAVQRLADNRTGIDNNQWKWDQAWEAVLDIKIWIMFFFNIAVNIPNGGLITFGALIINDLGFDSQTSALLSIPNGVISTISGLVASYCAAKWQGRRTFVIMIATLFPLFGTALVYALPRTSTGGQMFGLYMMYCYWGEPVFACPTSYGSANHPQRPTSREFLYLRRTLRAILKRLSLTVYSSSATELGTSLDHRPSVPTRHPLTPAVPLR